MDNKILVTGSTGNAGYEVVRILQKTGYSKYFAAVRDVEKAGRLLGKECSCRQFDFEEQGTFGDALKGIDSLFLVRPPHIADVEKYFRPLLESAKKEGVKHIVFLSLIGVEKNHFVPHRKIEKLIKDLGFNYTFLRAGFFMQNLSTAHRDEILNEQQIFIPAGNGLTSFIDVRDIAEVAVKALTENGHENMAYDLTGSTALSYYQIAEILSRVLNKEIRYSDPSIISFYRKHRRNGTAISHIFVMIALYSAAKFGMAGRIAQDLEKVLYRKPITFEKFAADHKSNWI